LSVNCSPGLHLTATREINSRIKYNRNTNIREGNTNIEEGNTKNGEGNTNKEKGIPI